MNNEISKNSFINAPLYSQQPGFAPLDQTSPESSIPQEKIAEVSEIFNQTMNSPQNDIEEQKTHTIHIKEAAGEQAPVLITKEMLDEMATALQYGLPINELIRNAPLIINTQLNNGMLPLHFAIHFSDPKVAIALLAFTDLKLKDAKGFDAFDHAVQMDNNELAKKIMFLNMEKEWNSVQESCESVQKMHEENPGLDKLLSGYSEEALPSVIKNIKSNAIRGSSTHNSLLFRTIGTSDYKAFIRALMAGASLATVDPSTGETLLHLAMKVGQEEIIYLLQSAVPGICNMGDFKGITPLQIAETNNKQQLVDLIHSMEKPEECSLEMKAKLGALDKNLKDYKDLYATKLDTLPENEITQLHCIATHGLLDHPEGSQGHNRLVLSSIMSHDLEQLVLLTSMGATVKSTSVPVSRALEDPMGYGPGFRTLQETNSETIRELKEIVWKDPIGIQTPGHGKSLLDMAVYYANDGEYEQKSLDVIAYLLNLGLDPMRINDEGESPFSTALIKGNYKAALLMLKTFEPDEAMLDRTYLLLREGSKLRDPLALSSGKVTEGLFAAAYLLTNLYAGNSVLSYINFIPLFLSVFGGLASSGPSYREKLTTKPLEPVYYPEIVKYAHPWLAKMSILEIAAMPQTPIAFLATTAIGVYSSAMEAMQSTKIAFSHVADRPFRAAYKVAVDTLPLAYKSLRFKSMLSSMFFPAGAKAEAVCKEIKAEDYRAGDPADSMERLMKDLKSTCSEHRKIVLTFDWTQKTFPQDTNFSFADKWDRDAFKSNSQRYIKGLYRRQAMMTDHDKNPGFEKFSSKIGETYEFLTRKETPFDEPLMLAPDKVVYAAPSLFSSTMKSIPYSGVILDTAAKAGVVWAASTSFFERNVLSARSSEFAWSALAIGSVGFQLGKGLYKSIAG